MPSDLPVEGEAWIESPLGAGGSPALPARRTSMPAAWTRADVELGRLAVGSDISPRYLDRAAERLWPLVSRLDDRPPPRLCAISDRPWLGRRDSVTCGPACRPRKRRQRE